jgi:hypothetical protein
LSREVETAEMPRDVFFDVMQPPEIALPPQQQVNAMIVGEETPHQERADVAGASGDETSHCGAASACWRAA